MYLIRSSVTHWAYLISQSYDDCLCRFGVIWGETAAPSRHSALSSGAGVATLRRRLPERALAWRWAA